MSRKQQALEALHKIYRRDKWIHDLFTAIGLDEIQAAMEDLDAQRYFETATWTLDEYEREADLEGGGTEADRRAAIEAAWKTAGKVDIDLLQSIADSWKNGEIDVEFSGGKIRLQFVGDYGVPEELDKLKEAMNEAKPAHLAVIYALRYLLIEDIHDVMTLEQLETMTLDKFAFRGGE